MKVFSFNALGTKWSIFVDHKKISQETKNKITKIVQEFEQKYSRFIKNSLVNKYNNNKKINDEEFKALFQFGAKLKEESHGAFNINVGKQLEDLGYGSEGQGIDFGGFGKGWLIDTIAVLLKKNEYQYFLIDAGGDIFATIKENHDSWKVALEHPTKPDLAIATIELNNSALAASSPFKRTWDNNHHLVDTKTGKPTTASRAVFVTASDAKTADGVSTTLSVCDKNDWDRISNKFECEYLVLDKNGVTKSKKFSVSLF